MTKSEKLEHGGLEMSSRAPPKKLHAVRVGSPLLGSIPSTPTPDLHPAFTAENQKLITERITSLRKPQREFLRVDYEVKLGNARNEIFALRKIVRELAARVPSHTNRVADRTTQAASTIDTSAHGPQTRVPKSAPPPSSARRACSFAPHAPSSDRRPHLPLPLPRPHTARDAPPTSPSRTRDSSGAQLPPRHHQYQRQSRTAEGRRRRIPHTARPAVPAHRPKYTDEWPPTAAGLGLVDSREELASPEGVVDWKAMYMQAVGRLRGAMTTVRVLQTTVRDLEFCAPKLGVRYNLARPSNNPILNANAKKVGRRAPTRVEPQLTMPTPVEAATLALPPCPPISWPHTHSEPATPFPFPLDRANRLPRHFQSHVDEDSSHPDVSQRKRQGEEHGGLVSEVEVSGSAADAVSSAMHAQLPPPHPSTQTHPRAQAPGNPPPTSPPEPPLPPGRPAAADASHRPAATLHSLTHRRKLAQRGVGVTSWALASTARARQLAARRAARPSFVPPLTRSPSANTQHTSSPPPSHLPALSHIDRISPKPIASFEAGVAEPSQEIVWSIPDSAAEPWLHLPEHRRGAKDSVSPAQRRLTAGEGEPSPAGQDVCGSGAALDPSHRPRQSLEWLGPPHPAYTQDDVDMEDARQELQAIDQVWQHSSSVLMAFTQWLREESTQVVSQHAMHSTHIHQLMVEREKAHAEEVLELRRRIAWLEDTFDVDALAHPPIPTPSPSDSGESEPELFTEYSKDPEVSKHEHAYYGKLTELSSVLDDMEKEVDEQHKIFSLLNEPSAVLGELVSGQSGPTSTTPTDGENRAGESGAADPVPGSESGSACKRTGDANSRDNTRATSVDVDGSARADSDDGAEEGPVSVDPPPMELSASMIRANDHADDLCTEEEFSRLHRRIAELEQLVRLREMERERDSQRTTAKIMELTAELRNAKSQGFRGGTASDSSETEGEGEGEGEGGHGVSRTASGLSVDSQPVVSEAEHLSRHSVLTDMNLAEGSPLPHLQTIAVESCDAMTDTDDLVLALERKVGPAQEDDFLCYATKDEMVMARPEEDLNAGGDGEAEEPVPSAWAPLLPPRYVRDFHTCLQVSLDWAQRACLLGVVASVFTDLSYMSSFRTAVARMSTSVENLRPPTALPTIHDAYVHIMSMVLGSIDSVGKAVELMYAAFSKFPYDRAVGAFRLFSLGRPTSAPHDTRDPSPAAASSKLIYGIALLECLTRGGVLGHTKPASFRGSFSVQVGPDTATAVVTTVAQLLVPETVSKRNRAHADAVSAEASMKRVIDVFQDGAVDVLELLDLIVVAHEEYVHVCLAKVDDSLGTQYANLGAASQKSPASRAASKQKKSPPPEFVHWDHFEAALSSLYPAIPAEEVLRIYNSALSGTIVRARGASPTPAAATREEVHRALKESPMFPPGRILKHVPSNFTVLVDWAARGFLHATLGGPRGWDGRSDSPKAEQGAMRKLDAGARMAVAQNRKLLDVFSTARESVKGADALSAKRLSGYLMGYANVLLGRVSASLTTTPVSRRLTSPPPPTIGSFPAFQPNRRVSRMS